MSIVLRLLERPQWKDHGHLFMAMTSFFAVLRFMKNLYGFQRIGPYLVMLSRMVKHNFEKENSYFILQWSFLQFKNSYIMIKIIQRNI